MLKEKSLGINRESEIYHDYYHSRSLKNWLLPKQLIKDNVDQILYPIKSGFLDINKKAIFEVLDSHIDVLPYNIKKYESIMKSIVSPNNNGKSKIVLFNHDNFATMVAFIKELYKFAKEEFDSINLKKDLNIVVGPAITTQKQIFSLQSLANILKTVPSRDKIDDIENKIKSIRLNFLKQLLSLTKNSDQIVLMAPTGTRDIINWNADWTIKSISFQSDDWVEQTIKVIKSLAESEHEIVLVGTNGTSLKNPNIKWLKETDNNRSTWDVFIDIKTISSKEIIDIIDQKKLMDTIAWLVRDKNGNIVWEVISPEDFDVQKNNPQKIDFDNKRQLKNNFKDSIRKKVVRKVYNLLK